MYQTTDFRKNLKIEIDGKPYVIVEFQHVNPGKGSAFVRTRLKNLETGQTVERTFKAGVETVDVPDLEERDFDYMYSDGEGHHFLDQGTYESIHLTAEQVGDSVNYLQEGIKLSILFYKGRPISVELQCRNPTPHD